MREWTCLVRLIQFQISKCIVAPMIITLIPEMHFPQAGLLHFSIH